MADVLPFLKIDKYLLLTSGVPYPHVISAFSLSCTGSKFECSYLLSRKSVLTMLRLLRAF